MIAKESVFDYHQRTCGIGFWGLVRLGMLSIGAAILLVIRGRGATVGPALVLSVPTTPLVGPNVRIRPRTFLLHEL